MINKNLLFRLLIGFIAISILTIIVIENKKEESLNNTLLLEKEKLKNSYINTLDIFYEKANLIFYNNLYDEQINTLFINAQKEKLYEYLKDDFFFLKSKGLKQLSFYTKDNKKLLSMNKFLSSNFLLDKQKAKKEHVKIKVLDEDSVLSFTKAIFDKDLKFMGTIQLEFSLNSLIKNIMQNIEFNSFFLLENKSLNSKNYKTFILNKNFVIRNDNFTKKRFEEDILLNIKKHSIDDIKIQMKNNRAFSFLYKNKGVLNPVFFIPIIKESNRNIYLFSYLNKKESLYNQIEINYNLFLLFVIFLYVLLVLFLYKFLSANKSKNSLEKKHKDFLGAIDKYVVMVETDTKGIITYVTQAFCEICGYTKEELISKNINVLRHPDVSPKFFEALWKQLKENHKWEGEIKNLNKFANSYWVKGTITAKYNSNNEVIGYMSIRVNTTDSKQLKKINSLLKEDLSNRLNEIKMKDKNLLDSTKVALMSKVLDAVAHQWKTPISNISINLSSLKAKVSASRIKKDEIFTLSENIEQELKSLSLSLNEFKSYFIKTSDNDKYDINEVIKEAVSSVKNDINTLNATVSLNSKENILCYGVHNEFKHIIVNIIKNSLKEIASEKIKNPTIDISVLEDKNDILIKYCDNLEKENRAIKNIFEEENSQNIKEEDMLIYITKLLIEKAGAKVWFEQNNEGLALYIKLVSKDRRKMKR